MMKKENVEIKFNTKPANPCDCIYTHTHLTTRGQNDAIFASYNNVKNETCKNILHASFFRVRDGPGRAGENVEMAKNVSARWLTPWQKDRAGKKKNFNKLARAGMDGNGKHM